MALIYNLSKRERLALSALLLAVVAIISCIGLRDTRVHSGPRASEAYEWPTSCPKGFYEHAFRISKACTRQRRYRLDDSFELGLGYEPRGRHWFRVGDDALLLDCETWGSECYIKARSTRKFVRPS
jgi:hypothetical protein